MRPLWQIQKDEQLRRVLGEALRGMTAPERLKQRSIRRSARDRGVQGPSKPSTTRPKGQAVEQPEIRVLEAGGVIRGL